MFLFRAINNNLLDTYQLKSLDAALEGNVEDLIISKTGDKLLVSFQPEDKIINSSVDLQTWSQDMMESWDNFALRDPYDRIIRCLGFTYDPSLFKQYVFFFC